jgi:hypothetical protein
MTNGNFHVDPRAIKDPEDWKTGAEPMMAAQRSYLQTLAQEAQQPVDDDLTKAEVSKEIEHLQQATGRDAASKKPVFKKPVSKKTASKERDKRRDPRRAPLR